MASRKSEAAVQAICDQGLALHRAGRLDEAKAHYKRVLQRDPKHFNALHLLGTILVQSGQVELGAALIRRAISVNPAVPAAHGLLATALSALNRPAEALAEYDKAIALAPDVAEFHYNKANQLHELRRPLEALASFEAAIRLNPRFTQAHYNLARVQDELNRPADALASYEAVIALNPGLAEAHFGRALALSALKRPEEALASYDKAIELRPDDITAHHNRGNLLRLLGRLDAALASFDKAIALRPDAPDSHLNRGVTLHDLQRPEEALASYDRAIALRPDHAAALWNKSLTLLRQGQFDAGWRLYEWRKTSQGRAGADLDAARLWLGAPDPRGMRLFLHHEQGLGDTIQFFRYINILMERGANISISVQDSLRTLLAQLAPHIEFCGETDCPPEFDYHCPLPSLPLAFHTRIESIPSYPRYLRADADRRARFEALLGPRTKPRVGLVWSGNPSHENDHNRSIEFQSLLPLLSEDVEWISLQNEIRARDAAVVQTCGRVSVHGDRLKDFNDTAALVDLMDVVITVDTSLAHLAGAMGKPVWILLPFSPDWRWMLHRADSPWYPSARLFRQHKVGDWTGVIEEVGTELQSLAGCGDSHASGG